VNSPRNLEGRFLGSLLGLAIGDALGMPLAGFPVDEAQERHGEIRGYVPRNPGGEDEIPAGEITDETETVLCIVESMTANHGLLEPEIVNVRLMRLVEGPSRHWMPESMQEGIRAAWDADGVVPESDATGGSLAVAVRGVPIGLMHSVGGFDEASFRAECQLVTRLSHGGVAQQQLVLDVATAIVNLLRDEPVRLAALEGELGEIAEQRAIIADLTNRLRSGAAFDEVVLAAVNTMRPADSAGALAGALAGAKLGVAAIPQGLIDGLEARVYLSLAAPWFYKTAARRAGTIIDLRPI
jgi:ADP-ribosylglycohydrolase